MADDTIDILSQTLLSVGKVLAAKMIYYFEPALGSAINNTWSTRSFVKSCLKLIT